MNILDFNTNANFGRFLEEIGKQLQSQEPLAAIGQLQTNAVFIDKISFEPGPHRSCLKLKILSGVTVENVPMPLGNGETIRLCKVFITGLQLKADLLPIESDGQIKIFDVEKSTDIPTFKTIDK